MNKTICAAPWVHFHVIANGNFFPCCQWSSELPIGNVQSSTLNELIHGPEMTSVRASMLAGTEVEGCRRCYQLEDGNAPSMRQSLNKKYLDKLALTPEDSSGRKFRLQHFDVRFSNLCNLKCRSCGLDFSSSWYEDQIALYGKNGFQKFITNAQDDGFWNDLLPHLQDVNSVYFAGGEPLIEKRHYDMLQFFIDNGKTDIEIIYTTNFSQLTFDKFKVLPYWEKFENILVCASLDASGARGEYLRKGIRWKNIESNIQTLKSQAPRVRFRITPTLSAYNVFHWPDFHREWIERGWISADDIHTSYLTHPEPMSMQVLPADFKNAIREKYEKHLDYLKTLPRSKEAAGQFNAVVHFLFAKDHANLIPEFLAETEKIDKLRKENLFDVFPELGFLN